MTTKKLSPQNIELILSAAAKSLGSNLPENLNFLIDFKKELEKLEIYDVDFNLIKKHIEKNKLERLEHVRPVCQKCNIVHFGSCPLDADMYRPPYRNNIIRSRWIY